ncbi:hypothetical protein A3736_14820 [Erythrobacter sp. HI0063]|uniref:hypothetical protein n=1 Tax=unclassified Erythrobacter TaxID=2633097 RepID=UPI0007C3F31D|nr:MULTISPECIES: hypothetical protein [unclassified Erythrobacter]KZY54306.1 hypothetical protein A3736_14820 [Erythrobacter sp. HI0063]MBO9510330.1 hypothetical protein [Erythrobacter sp. A6_0]
MDLADLMQNYFGTRDLAAIEPDATRAGVERMRVDFGLEKDRGRRFALWTLLHMFDAAPDLDVAFEHEEDREAARNLMDLMAQASTVPED